MTITLLRKDRFYGWFILALVSFLYLLMNGFFMYSFGLFLPSICREFGWSRTVVSGANGVFMGMQGLIGPIVGIFIARYGAKLAWITGNTISAAGLVLLAFHSHVWQLYCAYGGLIGVGMGLGGILTAMSIGNNWFEKKRALAFAVMMASSGVGGIILSPALMRLIEAIGWRFTYGIMAAGSIIFLVILPGLLLVGKPEDIGQVPDGKSASAPAARHAAAARKPLYSTPVDFTAGQAVRTPAFWILNTAGILQVFVMTGFMAHTVSFLLDVGLAATIAAGAMGVLAGLSTAGRLAIGFLGMRYNVYPLAIGSFCIYAVGVALALVTHSQGMAFVYSAIVGLGFGMAIVSLMNVFPTYFGRSDYPRIMGFGTPLAIVGGCSGAPIFGRLRDITGSYTVPFEIATAALLLAVVLLAVARPPVHPSLKAQRG